MTIHVRKFKKKDKLKISLDTKVSDLIAIIDWPCSDTIYYSLHYIFYFQLNHDNGKEGKKQEDIHSDMSAETATYDSGIGGSVSDTGNYRQLPVYKQTITPTPSRKTHTQKTPVKMCF
mgnify:FL=1